MHIRLRPPWCLHWLLALLLQHILIIREQDQVIELVSKRAYLRGKLVRLARWGWRSAKLMQEFSGVSHPMTKCI